MSIDKQQHYQARQSYADDMKQAALRDAERQQLHIERCSAILNQQVEEQRQKAVWRKAVMENAIKLAQRRKLGV